MLNNLCRIGMDIPKNRWWQWLAGGLLGLLLLTMLTRCGSVQDDIQNRAQTLLNDKGLDWATVDLQDRGRDAIITGKAPNEGARDEAISMVKGLYGTRVVDHDITLKQYVSSTFALKHSDNQVILNGTLPDQATIDKTVGNIQQLYGADSVTNNLAVSDDASAPKWLAGVAAMLPAIAATRNIELSANDEAIRISGDVETEDVRDEVMGIMDTSFGEKLQASIDVIKTGPTEAELAAIAAEKARQAAAAEEAARQEAERLAAEKAAEAKKARLIAEAEAAKKAAEEEATRLAAEAAAKKAAEEEAMRLAAEAASKKAAEEEQARLLAQAKAAEAEKARIAAEAEAAQKTAVEAQLRQRMAVHHHNMMMAQQRRKIVIIQSLAAVKYDPETMPPLPLGKPLQLNNQSQHMVKNCESALNRLVSNHPPIFSEDSAELQQGSQNLLAQLNTQIRLCSAIIKQNGMQIKIAAEPQRAETTINYLQDKFKIESSLLGTDSAANTADNYTQLHFTITQ